MLRNILESAMDSSRRTLDDGRFRPEDIDRDRSEGARDRASSRIISGVVDRARCATGLTCMEDTCTNRPPTNCEMSRDQNSMVRCDEEDGMFNPLQCRRGDQTGGRLQSLNCYCVNRTSGMRVDRMMTRVTGRDELPNCNLRTFRNCTVMRSGQRVRLNHGQSIPQRRGDTCMRCMCNDGNLECSRPEGGSNSAGGCERSDPSRTPRNCMDNDGTMIRHLDTVMRGMCNRCGCRNGTLRCTRIPQCSGDDDSDETDQRCDACNGMRGMRPVCDVNRGQTFHSMCHAMNCGGREERDIEMGACSERDSCARDSCTRGTCLQLGGETRMSSERASPQDRIFCVNRDELRCLPTRMERDGRRVVDDQDEDRNDPFEPLENEGDEDDEDDDDDESVCGSDGNTYPSMCHMMVESRGNMIPRVRHGERCSEREMRPSDEVDEDDMDRVCGTDGVTYENERVMRTQGGNVRMDYRGRCGRPDNTEETENERCMRVRMGGMCANLTRCSRMVRPLDACCPVCGGLAVLALDQEAIDQQVRNTGDLRTVDDIMRGFARDDLIMREATERCNVSATISSKRPGRSMDVLYEPKDMSRDGMFCHMQAERMVTMLNRNNDREQVSEQPVSIEQSVVASSVLAPEFVDETGSGSGAPAITASFVMLLCTFFAALLF